MRAATRDHLRLLLTYALAAWLAYTLVQTIQQIIAEYVPLPVGDYWRVAENLRDYQNLHLTTFWRPHNEHRIVFPEIVFALDMLLAHGRMILPLAASVLCYFLAWAFLSLTVLRHLALPMYPRLWAVLLSGILAFYQGSALVLGQPFQLQWPLMQFAVVLALVFLPKANDENNRWSLAAAITAAIVATYSSANALLLWPELIAIAWLARLQRRSIAALVLAAITACGLYFVGYKSSGQTNLSALALHPAYFVGFVASYLSMPFSSMMAPGFLGSPAFGVLLGLTTLLVVILLAVWAVRRGLFGSSQAITLFGYYLFTLLTIAITAAGRMDLTDPNFTAAKVPRYLTVPLLNWAAFILLCLWAAAQLRSSRFVTPWLVVLGALLLLLGFRKLQSWQRENSHEFSESQAVAMSVDNGLRDEQLLSKIFPSPEFVLDKLPALEHDHLGLFYRDHQKWLGRGLVEYGRVSQDALPGAITYIYPVEGGVQLMGWINSDDVRNPFPRIFFANERGQIVGFGRRPSAGLPNSLPFLQTPAAEAWVGFANLATPSLSVQAYADTHHGLAPIQGAKAVPIIQAAARESVGSPLTEIAWRPDPAWSQKPLAVKPRFGWTPSAAVYGSSEHDQATGRIVAEFTAPSNCIILPILHGPSIGGAFAQLIDTDSGAVLAGLPFKDGDLLWSLWRVPLNAGGMHLRFIASDLGAQWGQWLAVSAPLSCK